MADPTGKCGSSAKKFTTPVWRQRFCLGLSEAAIGDRAHLAQETGIDHYALLGRALPEREPARAWHARGSVGLDGRGQSPNPLRQGLRATERPRIDDNHELAHGRRRPL